MFDIAFKGIMPIVAIIFIIYHKTEGVDRGVDYSGHGEIDVLSGQLNKIFL